jgi:hypothetical protein
MSSISIESFVRLGDGEFTPIREVRPFAGDCAYVPGAIVLSVDGVAVLSLDLWDDINWLWPYVVQALDDCRRTGTGERYFPDQPILFRAKTAGSRGEVLLSVTGESLTRKVVVPAHELFPAVAEAGLDFFTELDRLCGAAAPAEVGILEAWKDS